jgi:hypothetical protein
MGNKVRPVRRADYLAAICENYVQNNVLNSVDLVRELTKTNELPPLVGQVSANFSG